MDFSQWIDDQYIIWSKGRKSETQFAQWLGISQATFNAWKRKARGAPRSQALIKKLADKLGPEVYDVLGLVRPEASTAYESFPADFRRRLADADRELLRRRAELGLTNPDSPEVLAIAMEVFEKYGFKVTVKE